MGHEWIYSKACPYGKGLVMLQVCIRQAGFG